MNKQWTNLTGIIIFGGIFMSVLAFDIAIVYGYYKYVEHFLQGQPEELNADAGIVFFGDYKNGRSDLGTDSQLRALEAIELFKSGKIKSIICVGGYDFRHWHGKPHLMKKFLLKHGIPVNQIFHDTLSYNTLTNWEEACKIIQNKKFREVVAISAPLHTYRIARMIRSDSVFYHAYRYDPESFGDFWQIFKDVHREWLSHFLSFALKDNLRNRAVHMYRTVRFEMERVL